MDLELATKWAIENIQREGLTDIFSPPFELKLLDNKEFAKSVKAEVIKSIRGYSLASMRVNPIEHVLLPKTSAFDFRRCALIQPMDTIKYLTLSLLFAEELEKRRPKKSKKIVFSYRFHHYKGYIFDPKYNFTSFKKYYQEKINQKQVKILVSCDIANFYDRLNLHRLESILLSFNIEKNYIRLINNLLLSWANRDSYGLPVGSNASRILAEAALLEVDNYLLSLDIKFCRFVDDYRFFAPDIQTAHYWLTLFIERLWLEGLTINKSKTKIEDVSEQKPAVTKQFKKEVNSKENRIKIIAGYGGTIPTRFRESNQRDIKNFRKFDAKSLLLLLKNETIINPEMVNNFLRSSLYSKKTDLFFDLPIVLEKFPQFTPLIVDMLLKNNSQISQEVKDNIAIYFSNLILDSNQPLPEYQIIYICKLLGSNDYHIDDTLLKYFRSLKRNAGAYIGRIILESIQEFVSRGEALEIRNYFNRADQWEKRQIINIVHKCLEDEEKRPWFKNIKIQESDDIFLLELIEPHKKVRRRRKR